MRTSESGIDFIKRHEGFRKNAYRDPGGRWTIGYGHLLSPNVQRDFSGETITRERAEELLRYDIQEAERCVNNHVTVPLTQNQFDALVSWTYNLGCGNLKSSTMLDVLNAEQYNRVPDEIQRWTYIDGEHSPGLANRRQDEANLFVA